MYVSTGQQYVQMVQDQLKELPAHHVIGEPQMRDVGPAVGLMTAILLRESPAEPMVILWSDHLVKMEEFFRRILAASGRVVTDNPNKIVFVAQKPRFASENLGWIQYGKRYRKRTAFHFILLSIFIIGRISKRPSGILAELIMHGTWDIL